MITCQLPAALDCVAKNRMLCCDSVPGTPTVNFGFGTPCFRGCGPVNIARAAIQPDLPRRARHARERKSGPKRAPCLVLRSIRDVNEIDSFSADASHAQCHLEQRSCPGRHKENRKRCRRSCPCCDLCCSRARYDQCWNSCGECAFACTRCIWQGSWPSGVWNETERRGCGLEACTPRKGGGGAPRDKLLQDG